MPTPSSAGEQQEKMTHQPPQRRAEQHHRQDLDPWPDVREPFEAEARGSQQHRNGEHAQQTPANRLEGQPDAVGETVGRHFREAGEMAGSAARPDQQECRDQQCEQRARRPADRDLDQRAADLLPGGGIQQSHQCGRKAHRPLGADRAVTGPPEQGFTQQLRELLDLQHCSTEPDLGLAQLLGQHLVGLELHHDHLALEAPDLRRRAVLGDLQRGWRQGAQLIPQCDVAQARLRQLPLEVAEHEPQFEQSAQSPFFLDQQASEHIGQAPDLKAFAHAGQGLGQVALDLDVALSLHLQLADPCLSLGDPVEALHQRLDLGGEAFRSLRFAIRHAAQVAPQCAQLLPCPFGKLLR
jgi:hypothetical protein